MTIHDGTPFIASLTRLPGGTVGLLTVTHTGSAAAAGSAGAATATATTRRRRAIFNVIFDNSGSMGGYTKLGLLTLVRPMLEKAWFDTTVVTLFEEGATSFDVPTPAACDDMMKRLPVQQRTNITLGVAEGVKAATAALLKIPCEDDVHILTMLLTDGGHNVGAPITTAIAEGVAKGLAAAEAGRVAGRRRHEQQQREGGAGGVLHTVLAFCLTNDSDASASMIVKEVLETAKVPTLPSVFYAASHSEMAAALTGVVDACAALFDDSARGGQFATLEMQHMSTGGSGSGAEFIATGRDRTTHYFMPGQAETFVITLPSSPSSSSATSSTLSLTVGGAPVTVAQLGDVGPDGVSRALVAVKDALQPLTRQAVAFDLAVIDKRLRSLEGLVAAIDAVVVREKAAAGSAAACRTPVQRRELLKRFVTAQHGLHEIKNAVAALRVKGRSNSDSISLLTGNQRKFAAVASKRSGTESRTAAEVMANTTEIGAALRELVQQDLTAASTATTMAPSMTSVITLQTNTEFLAQWNDESTMVIGTDVVPVTASNSNDDAIMDVLSAFGIVAYPVELVTSDATQVDLMQLGVKRICPQQADTASMMLSWRLNSPIKFADGHTYTELLLLVDPALPRATTHVLQHSMLVQHLLSAMISKDLYMYLPPMHATMHVHSFAATVTKAIADAPRGGAPPLDCFVRMALHIVYSARRLFEAKVIFEEWANFERWLTELGSLTRSPSDQVYHVNSLSLKLAISSVDLAAVDDRTALLNQMNEALARRLVFAMSHFAAPVAFAQSLFGIDEADAPPVSENDLDTEPPRAAVEVECRKHIEPANVDGVADSRAMQLLSGGGGLTSVRALVEREWLPLFQMHQFTLAMHDTMAEHHRRQQSTSADGGAAMDNFTRIIEAHQQIPDWLVVGVQRRLTEWGTDAAAMWPFLLGVADGDFEADGRQEAKQIHAVCAAAVMQAALYPDTHARVNVVNTLDITDPVEQRRMIGELYMAHYDVACSLKLGRRRAVIGEVTALTAASADVDTFSALIGVHTHGHSKRAFWGMLRGLLSDANEARRQQKLDVFREKSSKPGFDNVVARGRPRRG